MLISGFAWAKDRVYACKQDPDGSICAELVDDCATDTSISILERKHCAQRGLLKVPESSQARTEPVQVGAEYIQPMEGDFDYNLTLQFDVENRNVASDGAQTSARIQWEIGFLDDLSLDFSPLELEGGYWFGSHVYTGLFFGFGYSFIKNGVLGPALYAPTGATARIRFTEKSEIYARGQVDWPFAWAGERRRRYDSGIGFGHELRSEVGLKIGHVGIAGVHRRFMGGDWVGVQLSVFEPEAAPFLRSVSRCHVDSECNVDELCNPETYVCTRKIQLFEPTYACSVEGLCSHYGYQMIAVNNSSCRMSDQCKTAGRCRQSSGGCVATDEACKKSDACKSSGLCQSFNSSCEVGSAAHCKKSTDCQRRGACTFDESSAQCMVSNSTQCQQSKGCLLDGDCGYFDGECVPTEEKHCKLSKRCKTHGFCRLFHKSDDGYGVTFGNQKCVNDNDDSYAEAFHDDKRAKRRACRDSGDCRIYGLCSVHEDFAGFEEGDKDGSIEYIGPKCTAGNVQHCAASLSCKARGACSKVSLTFENGTTYHGCRPATSADCARSSWCKYFGRCTLNDGVCVESK